jgi:hypothetical protein
MFNSQQNRLLYSDYGKNYELLTRLKTVALHAAQGGI